MIVCVPKNNTMLNGWCASARWYSNRMRPTCRRGLSPTWFCRREGIEVVWQYIALQKQCTDWMFVRNQGLVWEQSVADGNCRHDIVVWHRSALPHDGSAAKVSSQPTLPGWKSRAEIRHHRPERSIEPSGIRRKRPSTSVSSAAIVAYVFGYMPSLWRRGQLLVVMEGRQSLDIGVKNLDEVTE